MASFPKCSCAIHKSLHPYFNAFAQLLYQQMIIYHSFVMQENINKYLLS